jgi:putative nucleotidyltransferase with HDIG domain
MLIGRKDAIFMNVISALLIFVIDTFAVLEVSNQECYSSLIIAFSAGMIAIYCASKARTRMSVILIGLFIVLPIDSVILLLEIPTLIGENAAVGELAGLERIVTQMGYGLFGGVMSTVLFIAILPLFEYSFNCLTAFRLREITSSDAKILKKLKEEAPGTYNHSMVVAQLAEAGAAAIGESVDMARAAAMYHDVGKLHYPEHFTENQGDYNLHDELTPELSADIIRSHAKDGYTLIRNQHLPEFLADIALEHHGTLPIRYFYAKALKLTDGELNIEDYSYMGPKPQTKLAAIIMICDASEAAVRAVGARTPEAAEKAIRAVIEERMDLEQFSECDVTMADLTKIRQALVNALTGVYHHRIQYPSIKYRRTENGTKGENE